MNSMDPPPLSHADFDLAPGVTDRRAPCIQAVDRDISSPYSSQLDLHQSQTLRDS